MKQFIEQLVPFIVLGVFLAVGVVILYMLANAIIIGAMLGFVFYLINWVYEKIQHKPKINSPSGRIIEHE